MSPLCPKGVTASIVLAILLTSASCRGGNSVSWTNSFALTSAPDSVPRFGLLELAWRAQHRLQNPFVDVVVNADFTAPDGARVAVPGFYYGAGRWMVRFRPGTSGQWKYAWTLQAKGLRAQGEGQFECTTLDDGKGRVRQNPVNPLRWVLDNGDPYFPIGLQEGITLRSPRFAIDGEGRNGPRRDVSIEEYFQIYGDAGFNLFRYSQRNNTDSLFDDLDHYRERESIFVDHLLDTARRHGIRVMFGFFGFYDNWAAPADMWPAPPGMWAAPTLGPMRAGGAINRPQDSATIEKEKRFVRYCIARWGAYSDFWELLNERQAADQWTSMMAAYVHAVDPDHKPVSTSWEKPDLREIGINAPHWYESESELDSDLRVQQNAAGWKRFGKPVIVGEQGNRGMNWDPGSATRMRIRAWTALFQEITLVFWNTSWSKAGMNGGRYDPGHASNIYLGPEERSYIRALSDFGARLDPEVRISEISVAGGDVRVYGLKSPRLTAAYLHRFGDHTTDLRGLKITLACPESSRPVAEWIDPATGAVISRGPVCQGEPTLDVPPFRVDLALLVK
jgi:hypothetical protein